MGSGSVVSVWGSGVIQFDNGVVGDNVNKRDSPVVKIPLEVKLAPLTIVTGMWDDLFYIRNVLPIHQAN